MLAYLQRNDDWTPQQILCALNQKDISINELARQAHSPSIDFMQLEYLISEAIRIPLDQIWPSRYKTANIKIDETST